MDADGPAAALQPHAMGEAGRAVWESLTATPRSGAELALIAEAARIADRCRRLDDVLTGHDEDVWLRLVDARGGGGEVVIRVDGALQEARQQAIALKQILAQIEVEPAGKEESEDDIDFGGLHAVRPAG